MVYREPTLLKGNQEVFLSHLCQLPLYTSFPFLLIDFLALQGDLALGGLRDLWIESPKSPNPTVQRVCFTCRVLVIYSSHYPGIFRKVMF